MKDRILIDTEDYRRIGSNLQTLSDELSDCAATLSRVMLTNDAGGKLQINLSGALRTVSGSMPDGQVRNVVSQMRVLINRLSAYSDRLASATNQASNMFDSTEHKLAAMQMSESQEAVFSNGGGSTGGNPNANPGNFDWAYHLPNVFQWAKGQLQQLTEYDSSVIYDAASLIAIVIGNTVAVSDGKTSGTGYITDSREWSLGSKYEYKTDRPHDLYRKKSEGKSLLKDRVPLLDLSAERTISESAFHTEIQSSNENSDGKVSVNLFKTTKTGKIYTGLGVVNENGEYQLSPAYGAEIGISHTIFEETISGNYELIDNVSVQNNLTVSAGKLDANAEMVVGFDEDGDVDAHVGLGAEALGGELKGDIGLNIGGVDGTVGASVNYGIGAKAEFGLQNGKFVYDVGASFGVGASIYGEIDVSGLVENIGGALENVKEGAEAVGSYVYKGAKAVGNAVSGFCESAWNYFCG